MTNYNVTGGDDGLAYVTNGTYSGGTITGGTTAVIHTFKVVIGWINQIVKIPKPLPSEDESGIVETYLINLRRITKTITCDGKLVTLGANTRDDYYDAFETLLKYNKLLTFIWKNNTQTRSTTVSIEKANVDMTESLGKYTIKATMVVGVEKGA